MRNITAAALALCLVLVTGTVATARQPLALGYSHEPAGFQDRDMANVDRTIKRIGTKPATWTLWSNWGSRGNGEECLPTVGRCAFPSEAAAGLEERGITPMIWWTPVATPGREKGQFARYERILKGRHDDYIRQWAEDAKAHRGPIILRFAHEMNGKWYPWGLVRFDNSPTLFVEAWRYIWGIFRDVGATNVRWMWSPAKEDCKGCEPNYRYESFYPGNEYVDYLGLNVYNSARNGWRSMADIVEQPMARYREMTASASFPNGKPVIIGEAGTHFVGGSKADWLRDGYNDVFRRWATIKAIVYFDVNMGERRRKDPDWSLGKPADGSAWRIYQEMAAMPRFRGDLRWRSDLPEPEPSPVPPDPEESPLDPEEFPPDLEASPLDPEGAPPAIEELLSSPEAPTAHAEAPVLGPEEPSPDASHDPTAAQTSASPGPTSDD